MLCRGSAYPQRQRGSSTQASVRVLQWDAQGVLLSESSLSIGERVRNVREGPDGFIYVPTDESDGKLYRFEPIVPYS